MPDVTVEVVDASVSVEVLNQHTTIELGTSGPQGSRGSNILSGAGDPSPVIGLIGDQYINTTTTKLFGPKTESGWGEGVFLGANSTDVAQIYTQQSPSTVWNIAHTLGFTPNITIVDDNGEVILCDLEYVSENSTIATFSEPISGTAYLS